MDRIISQLMFYNNGEGFEAVESLAGICRDCRDKSQNSDELRTGINNQVRKMLQMALDYGFKGNVWHCFIALLLMTSENTFSRMCERRPFAEGTIADFASDDLDHMYELFNYDFSFLEMELGIDCFTKLENYVCGNTEQQAYYINIARRINPFTEALEAVESPVDFGLCVMQFYEKFGSGKLGLNRAFRLSCKNGVAETVPINNMEKVSLEDIIGYDRQKQELVANTRAFISGGRANNVLLYGDSGTGKSTSIKAVVNEFYDDGIRMIEIYKHQFEHLMELLALIKGRNYKFIIYMDDLSFEQNENQYKFLKAVIEGGVETKPDNVLIYATSNRRHLIKETWTDRNDSEYQNEIHHSETMEEKLSLAARFGMTINYPKPGRGEYMDIIKGLAKREGLSLSEDELAVKAVKWEMRHGGLSGRTAKQFITFLRSEEQ